MERKINVGIFGGTGYTGGELCRLLLNHPNVSGIFPTSREEEEFERYYPNLLGSGLSFVKPEDLEARAKELDAVFFSLPDGESMNIAHKFLNVGVKVIDLGPDFRFKNPETYEAVYGRKHTCPELIREAVYGITEFNREQIRQARLIANPGCYVITAMLGLAPLLRREMIELEHIPINAINGTTGASSKAQDKGIMHVGVVGNILPYNLEGHRHSSELEEQIKNISGQHNVVVLNTYHGDWARGISSIASPLVKQKYREELTREKLLNIFREFYLGEFFVRVVDFEKRKGGIAKEYDVYPQIKNVRGTNFCDIGVDYDAERGIIKVVTVSDNLGKGAAGNAIQNMNVMFEFDEAAGLRSYGF